MVVVGEAVDHGDLGRAREREDGLVLERPRLDHVTHPGEHPGGVVDRLAPSEVDLAGLEVEGVAAELCHPDLEGHPRASRRLLEDHPERAVAQQLGHGRVAVRILQQPDQIQQLLELVA